MNFTYSMNRPDAVITMSKAEIGDKNVRFVVTCTCDCMRCSFSALNGTSHILEKRLKCCADLDFIIDTEGADTLKRDLGALLVVARCVIVVLWQLQRDGSPDILL